MLELSGCFPSFPNESNLVKKVNIFVEQTGLGLMVDIKVSEISPRWPPILPKGTFTETRWELSVVDTSSISFVVNRIYKVNPLVLLLVKSIKADI